MIPAPLWFAAGAAFGAVVVLITLPWWLCRMVRFLGTGDC